MDPTKTQREEMNKYKCLRVYLHNNQSVARIEDYPLPTDLKPDTVLVHIEFTGINYKDALAVTGSGKILKSFPLIPGIDASGIVLKSKSPDFKEGDRVLINGCETGEARNGGMSELLVASSEHLIHLPPKLTSKKAMILGTAGFTAALAIHRMEVNGQTPDKGPIMVTGASGGVGQFAVQLLHQKGYNVVAMSGKAQAYEQLIKWGAQECISPKDFKRDERPLNKAQWGGAIDNLGGDILSQILSQTHLWGNIAVIGLAKSHKLSASVMPLILRGVSLLGVSSNNCPMSLRKELWQQLSLAHIDYDKSLHHEISLEEVPTYSQQLLQQNIFGRTLVNLSLKWSQH